MILTVLSTVDPEFPCPVNIVSTDGENTHIDNVAVLNYVDVNPRGNAPYTVTFEPSNKSVAIPVKGVASPEALVSLQYAAGYQTAVCYHE